LGATLGERSLVSLAGVWFERAVEAPRGLESVLMRQAASSVNLVLGAACGHTVGRGLCRPSRRLHLRMRPMRRLRLCRPYTLTHAQTAPAHAQVHLYDVDLSEQGGPVLQESRGTAPGHEVRTAAVVVHPCCPLPIFDWLVGHAVIGCMPWPS